MKKEIAIVAAALALFAFTEGAADTTKTTVSHVVKSGETMYGIAEELAAEYGDRRDTREIVFQAKVASGKYRVVDGERYLDSTIRPGEVLTYVMEVRR